MQHLKAITRNEPMMNGPTIAQEAAQAAAALAILGSIKVSSFIAKSNFNFSDESGSSFRFVGSKAA